MVKERHVLVQKELEEDFSVNGVSIFRAFPNQFSVYELSFFEEVSYLFFPHALDRERVNYLCKQARLLYFATKMHILTMQYEYDIVEHKLEMTVLCGDLLSSRYALRLIEKDEYDVLKRWLSYQLLIVEELTNKARNNDNIDDRKRSQVSALFNRLLEYSETESESFGPAGRGIRDNMDAFVDGFLTGSWSEFQSTLADDREMAVALEQLIDRTESDRSIALDDFLTDLFNDAHWVKP